MACGKFRVMIIALIHPTSLNPLAPPKRSLGPLSGFSDFR